MSNLWTNFWHKESSATHQYVALDELSDVTYHFAPVQYAYWEEVAIAFNDACLETAGSLEHSREDPLHLYLKGDKEYHIYPCKNQQIDVIYIFEGQVVHYHAQCDALHALIFNPVRVPHA